MSCAGDSDSEDWPMEQEVVEEMEEVEEEEERLNLKMEPLLCDSPALLPTVTLTLTMEPASAASLSHTTQLNTQVCLLCLKEKLPQIYTTCIQGGTGRKGSCRFTKYSCGRNV